MSQWTHVAGIIRVDSIHHLVQPVSDGMIQREIKAVLGKPVDFDGLMADGESTLPMGSEGSLQYTVTEVDSDYGPVWGHVALWGDLRDHDDYAAIHEWLYDILEELKKRNYGIRQCIVHLDVEYQDKWALIYYDDLGLIMTKVPGEDK